MEEAFFGIGGDRLPKSGEQRACLVAIFAMCIQKVQPASGQALGCTVVLTGVPVNPTCRIVGGSSTRLQAFCFTCATRPGVAVCKNDMQYRG